MIDESYQRVRKVSKSILEQPVIGSWKTLGRKPETAFCSMRNSSTVGKPVALNVHAWSSKSKVIFYQGSHLHTLGVVVGATGWFEVSLDELKAKNIAPVELILDEGGL